MVTSTSPRKASSFASSHLPLLGIMVLAFVLRLVYLVFFTDAINPEGAEYARIAQNLLQGKGYVGLALEGRELMFPPLYPLTIATATVATRDFYLAAQVVSFTAGLALLVAVFGIASDLYGVVRHTWRRWRLRSIPYSFICPPQPGWRACTSRW